MAKEVWKYHDMIKLCRELMYVKIRSRINCRGTPSFGQTTDPE